MYIFSRNLGYIHPSARSNDGICAQSFREDYVSWCLVMMRVSYCIRIYRTRCFSSMETMYYSWAKEERLFFRHREGSIVVHRPITRYRTLYFPKSCIPWFFFLSLTVLSSMETVFCRRKVIYLFFLMKYNNRDILRVVACLILNSIREL